MKLYGLIELLVIGGAVLLSAWSVLGRLAPGLQARLLGRTAPPAARSCGSGSSCNSCGNCDSPKAPVRDQPIRFLDARRRT